MDNRNWAQIERRALADLFEQVGPDAPTLCEGWTTRDLAAHLVIRESRPDASVGILVKPLAGHTQRTQNRTATRPWPDLVAAVRNGPPLLSAFRLPGVDRLTNLTEFFVHHEDVRRAVPHWEPRELPDAEAEALWRLERGQASTQFLRLGIPALLVRTDGAGGRHIARRGSPFLTITGPVAELMLFTFGRRALADVEITGDEELVRQLDQGTLGF